ncbi:MAG: hypothetical protein WBL79_09760, partial [Bacillota bacterium]
ARLRPEVARETDEGEGYLPIKPIESPAVIEMGWINEGTSVYLQAFTHPRAKWRPAAIVIDQIQVGR